MSDLVEWLRAKYRRHGEIEDERAADELERLQSELDRAKDRERKAFEAGIRAGWDDMVNNPDDIDFDQAWQQYRSQDDSEGRAGE